MDKVTRKMWNDAVEAVQDAARDIGDATSAAERAAHAVERAREVLDAASRKVGVALADHKAKLHAFSELAKRVGAQGGTVEDKAERASLSESLIQGATGRGN